MDTLYTLYLFLYIIKMTIIYIISKFKVLLVNDLDYIY